MYRVMFLTLAALLIPATAAPAAAPDCTRAAAQERTFEDPVGDSGNAPDLGIVWFDVDDDCVVSITFALDGNRLLDGDSLSVTVDGRVFDARGRREGAHLIIFETTVEALGFQPGRPSQMSFGSRYGNDADVTDTFAITVDYGAVKGVQITGRAKPGKVLTCVTDEPVQWLRDGRAIRGATKRTYKLRRADAGRRIACRTASATSAAVRVQRR
jgi:hypothetical protein